MPYPQNFAKIWAFGFFGTSPGVDQWQAGLKMEPQAGQPDESDMSEAFLTALLPAFNTFHDAGGVGAGTSTALVGLRGAIIGPDGRYAGSSQVTTEVTQAPNTGSGTGGHPLPTACAYSMLSTQQRRGPGSHGRMMYPAVGSEVSGSGSSMGRFSGGSTAALKADAFDALITALNLAASTFHGVGWVVALLSPSGAGVRSTVDLVRVGDVPDHIERRESELKPETYEERVVTIP